MDAECVTTSDRSDHGVCGAAALVKVLVLLTNQFEGSLNHQPETDISISIHIILEIIYN